MPYAGWLAPPYSFNHATEKKPTFGWNGVSALYRVVVSAHSIDDSSLHPTGARGFVQLERPTRKCDTISRSREEERGKARGWIAAGRTVQDGVVKNGSAKARAALSLQCRGEESGLSTERVASDGHGRPVASIGNCDIASRVRAQSIANCCCEKKPPKQAVQQQAPGGSTMGCERKHAWQLALTSELPRLGISSRLAAAHSSVE
eukprot:4499368-Prymnesium_polylepis.3